MRPYLLVLLMLTFLPLQACAVRSAYVPRAADTIAEQLDKQLMARFGNYSGNTISAGESLSDRRRALRKSITIMGTVAVNLNNLEMSCPLSRQMTEEVSRWLINAGYQFQELRKGREIYFQKLQGEMLLTRDTKLLATRHVVSQAVLVGTYVATPEQVRFNMRLLHTPSNEVLAMASATVPITEDLQPLLTNTNAGSVFIGPSVMTRLK